MNRLLLKGAFTKHFGAGWVVHEAATAEEALALLGAGHGFHLAVLDEIFSEISMASDSRSLRGSEAMQRLRQREESTGEPPLPIIACTGLASQDAPLLLRLGANDVWDKPFPSFRDDSMQRRVAKLLPDFVVQPAG